MSKKIGEPTDMHAYRRRSERQLVIAIVLIFVIVGSVVIGLVYGWSSIFTALLCLLPGAGVFVLQWAILTGIEYLTKE
jgi:hypothetical protein